MKWMTRGVRKPGRLGMPPVFTKGLIVTLSVALAFGPLLPVAPAMAAPGHTLTTPVVPMELPIEVEIELSPAGSLKQALLWKELVQLLQNPYAPVQRRRGFGTPRSPRMPGPLTPVIWVKARGR